MSQVCPNTKQLCTSFRCEGGCYWGENAGKSAEQQGTPTPRTDALVEKHQLELSGTRRTDDPLPLLKLAQDQAIESMKHARQLERELSRSREDCERLREALKQAHDAMEAFTDPEGNMPADTGEFRELKAAMLSIRPLLGAPK